MTNKEILQSDLLDILFENRNKEYGAYTLRRNYNHNMSIALGCALSMVFLLMLLNSFSEKNGAVIIDKESRETVKLIPYTQHPVKPATRQVRQKKSTPIKIVSDNVLIQTEVPQQHEFENALISDKNVQVDPSTGTEKTNVNVHPGTNNQTLHEDVKPFIHTEKEASYPGGPKAFSKFLYRYLHPPEQLEPGDKITVRVRFLVDVDGSISNIEIIQSGGKDFDKEVVRVLRKMPKWFPAEQNGHKVTASFSQPVTFVGIEQ